MLYVLYWYKFYFIKEVNGVLILVLNILNNLLVLEKIIIVFFYNFKVLSWWLYYLLN